jgi:hypothetical protein
MGFAATPAIPELLAQQALPQRGCRYLAIDTDEALQHTAHTTVATLARRFHADSA